MKRLLLIAAVLALGAAKPELYKETEDFQYSRSSSDDGTKSGFYGAQRGNMGGNFERAHNMDGLAQNQMSGLVRQVEGELGDGSNTRTGSVFTSANSRGVYGSGQYDLRNLQGRNFQEGTSYGDSLSHSSLSSHHSSAFNDQSALASHSAGYQRVVPYRQSNNYRASQHSSHLQGAEAYHSAGSSSDIHNAGYHSQSVPYQYPDNYGSLQQASSLHTGTGVHGSDSYAYDHDSQAASATSHTSGQVSQSRYHSQSGYDGSHINQQASDVYRVNPTSRLIVATPVRVYGRPGQRVAVPVGVQTYDATHSASTADQHVNQNSEAEVLNNDDEQINVRPTTNSKHYESSYRYRKQWEKHSTSPEIVVVPVPTESPFPNKNSELYDDTHISNNQLQASALNAQSAHSSSAYSGFNSNTKTSSASHTNYQSGVDSLHSSGTALNSDALTHGAFNSAGLVDSTNALGTSDTRPRSYKSSYSYHKSWERQGDPYVIQPVGGAPVAGEDLQRLTASTNMNRQSAHSYGHHTHNSQVDCDESGQLRVARSVPSQYDIYKQGQFNDFKNEGQQTQDVWQQSNYEQENDNNFQKIEDLGFPNTNTNAGQQTQKKWDKLEDYATAPGKLENLEDLGQQTQNKWDNLEQFTQQTQNKLNNPEDVGQQSQNTWDNLGQESQNTWDTLGQQTQNTWDNQGQQTQNMWDNLGQQTQNSWNNFKQHSEDRWDAFRVAQSQTAFGQETQKLWSNTGNLEDIVQQTQINDGTWIGIGDMKKEFKNPWDDWKNEHPHQFDDLGNVLPNQNNDDLDKGVWNNLRNRIPNHEAHDAYDHPTDISQSEVDKNIERVEQSYLGSEDQAEDVGQQTHNTWVSPDVTEKNINNNEIQQNNSNNNQNKQKISIDNQNQQKISTFEQSDSENQIIEDTYKSHENNQIVYNTNQNSQNKQYFYFDNDKLKKTESGLTFDNLWDKINIFEGDINKSKNFTGISQNHSSSHVNQSENSNSHPRLFWKNSTHFYLEEINNQFITNDTNLSQNRNKVNISHNSHSNGYQGLYTTTENIANLTTTDIPVTINFTTILKSIKESQSNKNVRPTDIGRGDIGPEDIVSENVVSELPYYTPLNTQPQTTPKTYSKVYKTPEEADALDLIKETKQTDLKNDTTSTARAFVEINEDDQIDYNQLTTTNVSAYNRQDDTNFEAQFSELSQVSQEFLNFEQKNFEQENIELQSSDQQQINNMYQKYQNVLKQNESKHQIDQETMSLNRSKVQNGNKKWEYRPNVNLRERIDYHTQLQQNEHQEQKTNKTTEFNQQNLPSDTVWGMKLEEFINGPQDQKLAENFGQNAQDKSYTDNTLAESFKRSNEQQQVVQIYKDNLSSSNTGSNHNVPRSIVHQENHQGSIEKMTQQEELPQEQMQDQQQLSQNLQEAKLLQGIQLEDKDKIPIPPVETTTPKTGFWNSVGNKLSNAKNKMASWFHKS